MLTVTSRESKSPSYCSLLTWKSAPIRGEGCWYGCADCNPPDIGFVTLSCNPGAANFTLTCPYNVTVDIPTGGSSSASISEPKNFFDAPTILRSRLRRPSGGNDLGERDCESPSRRGSSIQLSGALDANSEALVCRFVTGCDTVSIFDAAKESRTRTVYFLLATEPASGDLSINAARLALSRVLTMQDTSMRV